MHVVCGEGMERDGSASLSVLTGKYLSRHTPPPSTTVDHRQPPLPPSPRSRSSTPPLPSFLPFFLCRTGTTFLKVTKNSRILHLMYQRCRFAEISKFVYRFERKGFVGKGWRSVLFGWWWMEKHGGYRVIALKCCTVKRAINMQVNDLAGCIFNRKLRAIYLVNHKHHRIFNV